MKNKLVLIGIVLGIVLILLVLGVIGFYLYLCRTIDVPTDKLGIATSGSYPIVDTAQSTYWNNEGIEITKPAQSEAFYGQDAQYENNAPSYKDNGDGTITDIVTGLMWTQTPDLNADGTIDSKDKLTLAQAVTKTSKVKFGGYTDCVSTISLGPGIAFN